MSDNELQEDAIASSNVSANLGGPGADNSTNISGVDLPIGAKPTKKVTPKVIARIKSGNLTEEDKDLVMGGIVLINEEYNLRFEI